jgi:hypothetical protein
MATLEELARKKFPAPPLSAAEERVVRAASDGTTANCIDLGGGDDPAKVDAWPASRNVRADLIRWLCIDSEARKQVDPRGVRIGGARITEPLDLSFTKVLFPLALASCRLEQDLDLKWAKMPLVSLQGSWTGAIHADGLKLEGSLFLSYGFHSDGEVRLGGATIEGDLSATGGTFRNSNGNALFADRINVTGGVFLKNGFSVEGEVRLLGATIGGNLEATGGTFKNLKSDKNPNATGNALSADGIKAGGGIFLSDKFLAEGEVRLPGAEITGRLEVVDAWLDALNLDSAHIAGPFFWQNIHKDPHPDFPRKEWKPSLDLTNAKVGALADEERSWPDKGLLRLDGFVYDRIGGNEPTDAKTRLRWLHLQPDELGYLPQPYEQLIIVLRRMGHEHQVAKVAIAKQKDLYERGDLGWWGWIRSWFLYLAVGYGYEPWRAFGWMAALVLLGTLVFLLARLPSVPVMVPSENEAYQIDEKTEKPAPPHYYPQFNAFVYSLDVILPFDLGQKSHWRLHERGPWDFVYWILEVYSLVQLFLGWVLLLVAAAVPARFIKKD